MRSLWLEFGLSSIEDRAVPRFRRRGLIGVLVAALASGALPGLAQGQETGRIVGRVTAEETGAPISAAQIYLPALQLGGLSRPNGSFLILQVPAGTHEVRVERIGLATATQQVTVTAGGVAQANFQLSTQALGLDEIVVTGTAGAARRREVGNTINQITVADIPARATVASELLVAAAPGVSLNMDSGIIGSGVNIRLRGNQSITMSNSPIIYVDGVRMQSSVFPDQKVSGTINPSRIMGGNNEGAQLQAHPLNNINPNDIERIEIIKGSAATTLYGTEAAAGVIQIFTKRGSSGAPIWSVETSQRLARPFKIGSPLPTQEQRDLFPYLRLEPYIRTAYQGSYNMSVRGGGEDLQYFMSAGHVRGIGITAQDTIRKNDVRANFTFTPAADLTIQFNSAYAQQWTRNSPGAGGFDGLLHSVYRGIAGYHGTEDPEFTKSVAYANEVTASIERFTTGATITYSPLASLTNRLTIGYDMSQQQQRNIRPFGNVVWPPGTLFNDQFQNRLLTLDYVGTYRFSLTSNIRSNFSLGGQAVGEDTHRVVAYGEDFPGVTVPTMSAAAVTLAREDRQEVWNAGFFFQNVFDISDRYFVTVGARVDGNSAFGEGFGLQLYPKASASWVISDESFWSEGLGTMKVRAAYGQSGRAPGAFDAVRTWTGQGGYDGRAAIFPANVGNSDLGPEVTTEFEFGFDAAFFNDRFETTFTHYSQRTDEALLLVPQIPSTGFASASLQNTGVISNKGIEMTLDFAAIQTASWGWDVGLSVATNNSEVIDLKGLDPFTVGQPLEQSRDIWIMEGQPAPVLRSYHVTNPDEIADPVFDKQYNYGPGVPTLTLQPSMTVRGPGGILVSARGEYMGGHVAAESNHNGAMVWRGGWAPICWPYYVNPYDGESHGYLLPSEASAQKGIPEFTTELKPDTPALWRSRCDPQYLGSRRPGIYAVSADHFKLRSLSMSIPVDFAFPDRVNSSLLTITATEPWRWYNDEWLVFDPEHPCQTVPECTFRGPSHRLPATWGVSASLRVQF